MKTILIRNIPDEVHKDFKIHCAQIGLSQNEVINRLIILETKDSLILEHEEVEAMMKVIDMEE